MNTDRTAEFLKIISTGTIDDICQIVLGDFHAIKHTDSFSAIVDRLRQSESERAALREENERLVSEVNLKPSINPKQTTEAMLDEALEHNRKLVERLREIRSFVKVYDGEEEGKLLEAANLEAFMDGLIYRVKGIPVSLAIVHEVETLTGEVAYLNGLLERNEGRIKKIVDEGLVDKIDRLETKIATVVKLIEEEEWDADFREVLLAELKG